MKANAWNKSRVTPSITNFLVLMFSIMAPAMAKRRSGMEKNKRTVRETISNVAEHVASTARWESELNPPSLPL